MEGGREGWRGMEGWGWGWGQRVPRTRSDQGDPPPLCLLLSGRFQAMSHNPPLFHPSTINNKLYVAKVKEKHQAKKMYEEARRQGQTAAHVGTRDRETEKFRVSASVAAGSQVSFELCYEELLQRHLGKYQHAVSVRPRQVVGNLTVEVSISERTGIDYVHVLPLRTSRLLTNTLRGTHGSHLCERSAQKGSHCAWVVFTPTPQEQAAVSSSGILGDFVVQYDVAMPDVIYNGYFVHYFAPRGLPPVQKNVVFVIDISGSMHGTKMKQTKKAMHIILSDLHPDDCFNIVTFSDTVHVWKAGRSILATAHNVRSAKDYVHRMEADGWTDINKALLEAASVLTQSTPEPSPTRIPLLIFLTDGEPTAGVTSGTRILANARQALGGSVSLFGLAFGDDADYGLLRRLALENRGVARRIYEDADATLQLAGFYDEIASPLLYDVALSYRDGADLTRTLFPHYFQGAELVVAGRLAPGATELHVEAAGHGHAGQLRLENDISANATEAALFGCSPDLGQIGRFVQRLWAYFTIQELLRARFHSNDTAARRLLTEKATNLSLKYNFVTPVTSLVVVKPEEEESTTARATPGAPGTPLTTTVAHPRQVGGDGLPAHWPFKGNPAQPSSLRPGILGVVVPGAGEQDLLRIRIMESQGWKGPQAVSSPTPCSKQDQSPDRFLPQIPKWIELTILGLAGQCSNQLGRSFSLPDTAARRPEGARQGLRGGALR
uniref:Inter-alpha-trypsin inhibitor heavy chain family member 6 n=1 Tax=Terrapene triunguis TaxID=2587831 RepID=A0A674J2Q4_9SAUR